MSVVFPAPFGPDERHHRPRRTSRSTERRTSSAPNRLESSVDRVPLARIMVSTAWPEWSPPAFPA